MWGSAGFGYHVAAAADDTPPAATPGAAELHVPAATPLHFRPGVQGHAHALKLLTDAEKLLAELQERFDSVQAAVPTIEAMRAAIPPPAEQSSIMMLGAATVQCRTKEFRRILVRYRRQIRDNAWRVGKPSETGSGWRPFADVTRSRFCGRQDSPGSPPTDQSPRRITWIGRKADQREAVLDMGGSSSVWFDGILLPLVFNDPVPGGRARGPTPCRCAVCPPAPPS